MVTEEKRNGNYYYLSPTHWGSDGICRVTVNRYGEADLAWASGGVNEGVPPAQVARAMSVAFGMAENRLRILKKQKDNK